MGLVARTASHTEQERGPPESPFGQPPRHPPAPQGGTRSRLAPVNGVVLRVFQESATVVSDVLSSEAVKAAPGPRAVLKHWGGPHALEGRVILHPGDRVKPGVAVAPRAGGGVGEQEGSAMKIPELPAEEALRTLSVGPAGLSQAEAARRLQEYGPNRVEHVEGEWLV